VVGQLLLAPPPLLLVWSAAGELPGRGCLIDSPLVGFPSPAVFASIGRVVWRDVGPTAICIRLLMKVCLLRPPPGPMLCAFLLACPPSLALY
jgi:hypothetical protein